MDVRTNTVASPDRDAVVKIAETRALVVILRDSYRGARQDNKDKGKAAALETATAALERAETALNDAIAASVGYMATPAAK